MTPAKATNPDLARKFIALATSPEVQAEGIVKQFNWYPGIDAEHIQAAIDDATWQELYADAKPEELASKGQPFPIGPISTTFSRPTSSRSRTEVVHFRQGGACPALLSGPKQGREVCGATPPAHVELMRAMGIPGLPSLPL